MIFRPAQARLRALEDAARRFGEGDLPARALQEEGERIERLVGDLLDLARFEAGGISLAQESVDVDELFERVSERHAKTAQDKQVSIVNRTA